MKILLVIIFQLIYSLQVKCQYIPTLVECNKWEVRRFEGMGSSSDYEYLVTGDISIENKLYKKAVLITGETLEYLREDTFEQRIYRWDSISQSEKLIIDYSLEKRDSFTININLVCDSISYDYLYNRLRKVIHFNSLDKFIEGIGYSFYGVANWNGSFQTVINFEENSEVCLADTENINLGKTDIKIYPNPVIDKLTLESNKLLMGNIYLLDINGRIVKHIQNSTIKSQTIEMINFPQGIYYIIIEDKIIGKVLKY